MSTRPSFRSRPSTARLCFLASTFIFTGVYGSRSEADVVGVRIGTDGSASSLPINSSSVQWGARFTANESITVNQALAKLVGVAGSPTFEVAVQADDGAGNPSGTDLGVATMGVGSGFNSGTFAAPVSLVQGNVYHFIQRVPNAGGGNSVSVASAAPGIVLTHGDDGTPENNYALTLSTNGGSSWSTFSDKTMWGLRDSVSGAAMGQGYDTQTFAPVGGAAWRGQSFTVDGFGGDASLSAVSMKVYKGAATAGDDLRAYLIDTTTGNSIWSDELMSAAAGASGPTGDEVFVSVPNLTLVGGRKYVLAVESAGSASGAYELFVAASQAPVGWLEALNYQEGEGSQYVFASSAGLPASFSALDNASARFDSFFSLDLQAVPEPATCLTVLLFTPAALLRRRRGDGA